MLFQSHFQHLKIVLHLPFSIYLHTIESALAYERLTIPFILEPIEIRFTSVVSKLTEDSLGYFLHLSDDLLNRFINEDIVYSSENTTGNEYEYYNLSISMEDTDSNQILLKSERYQNKPAAIVYLRYSVIFNFTIPYKRLESKVYEFPSLPTLQAIENQLVFAFQNRTKMEDIRWELVNFFPDELQFLETIEFDGYARSSSHLWSNKPQNDSIISPSLIIFRNLMFIFISIIMTGCLFYLRQRLKRKAYGVLRLD